VPPEHPLARTKLVLLAQLGTEKFVAHLAPTPSRKRLLDLFAREGVPLNMVMELSSLETIKDFVKQGEGIAIVPRMCCARELASGELVSPAVRGLAIGRDIRVVCTRTRTQSPAGAAFMDLLGRHYPEGDQPAPGGQETA
jgi:DNA-binding transcriptional LysR family regulator